MYWRLGNALFVFGEHQNVTFTHSLGLSLSPSHRKRTPFTHTNDQYGSMSRQYSLFEQAHALLHGWGQSTSRAFSAKGFALGFHRRPKEACCREIPGFLNPKLGYIMRLFVHYFLYSKEIKKNSFSDMYRFHHHQQHHRTPLPPLLRFLAYISSLTVAAYCSSLSYFPYFLHSSCLLLFIFLLPTLFSSRPLSLARSVSLPYSERFQGTVDFEWDLVSNRVYEGGISSSSLYIRMGTDFQPLSRSPLKLEMLTVAHLMLHRCRQRTKPLFMLPCLLVSLVLICYFKV